MGDKLFGFKYEWLEPAFADDPRYQDAELFIAIAKDIARIAVEELPDNFTHADVSDTEITDEQLQEAWSSNDRDRFSELLLIASIQYMNTALKIDLVRPNLGWEKMEMARTFACKATGKDPSGFSADFFMKKGREGGLKSSTMTNDFRVKLCKAIDTYLLENHIWNDPDSKGNIKDIAPEIWSEIEKETSASSDWNGYTIDTIKHARLGRKTISECVSLSKRRNV